MSVKPEKTCEECGKIFYLWCLPREYPFKKRCQKKGTDKTMYFCGSGCRDRYNEEHPTKTYNRW